MHDAVHDRAQQGLQCVDAQRKQRYSAFLRMESCACKSATRAETSYLALRCIRDSVCMCECKSMCYLHDLFLHVCMKVVHALFSMCHGFVCFICMNEGHA